MNTESSCDHLSVGLQAMRAEANAISITADRLNESFQHAVDILLATQSKLVICGIGKSGHIGGKLAATFSSCGLPSVFLHAAEAIHGDLGVYQPGDPTIVLSKREYCRDPSINSDVPEIPIADCGYCRQYAVTVGRGSGCRARCKR